MMEVVQDDDEGGPGGKIARSINTSPIENPMDVVANELSWNSKNARTPSPDPSPKKQFRFPLLGKVFYLDVCDMESPALATQIQQFGGRVEDAFNPKKVSHVITDRITHPPNTMDELISENPRLKYASPRVRRAELMLSKSKHMRSFKGQDVIQVAQKMRKKIIQLDKMKSYIASLMNDAQSASHGLLEFGDRPSGTSIHDRYMPTKGVSKSLQQHLPHQQAHVHQHPPIRSCYIRPVPRCAPASKEIQPSSQKPANTRNDAGYPHHIPAYSHSFSQPLLPVPANCHAAKLEDRATREFKPIVKVFAIDCNGLPTAPMVNFDVPPPYCPLYTQTDSIRLQKALAQSKRKEEKEKEKEKKESPDLSHSIKDPRAVSPSRRPGKKGGWCECCRVRFDDYDEHTLSPSHVEFISNSDNYNELTRFLTESNLFM